MTVPHLLFAILINLIWGSLFVVAALALSEFPPVFFTGLRFAMLTVLLAYFLPVPASQYWPLIRVGLVMGVGMYLTLYLAIYLAENTASIAIVSKLEVPFALLLGVIILKEYIGPQRIAGVCIAFLGAMIIGFDPSAINDVPALIAMAVSSILYGFTMIMVRQLQGIHPLTITAWVSLVSAPVLLTVSLLFEQNHLAVMETASMGAWLALAYTVVFGSVISHSGMYFLLQHYPVHMVAPFNLLSPVFAVIGGILFLEDVMTPALMIGGGLVLLGVGWIYIRTGKKTKS